MRYKGFLIICWVIY